MKAKVQGCVLKLQKLVHEAKVTESGEHISEDGKSNLQEIIPDIEKAILCLLLFINIIMRF